MRKLKLEELSPYLPYGLRCQIPKHRIRYGQQEILTLNGLSLNSDGSLNPEFLLTNDDLLFGMEIKWWKPIVHPMSDLFEVIQFDGPEKEFVPIDALYEEFDYCDAWGEWLEHASDLKEKPHEINFEAMPYGIAKKLFEWHFDLNFWIKDGIAVNINEL